MTVSKTLTKREGKQWDIRSVSEKPKQLQLLRDVRCLVQGDLQVDAIDASYSSDISTLNSFKGKLR